MVKGLLMLGMGVAAVGVAKFARTAIAEERRRRSAAHETHETHRWEGEGGQVMSPQSNSGAPAFSHA